MAHSLHSTAWNRSLAAPMAGLILAATREVSRHALPQIPAPANDRAPRIAEALALIGHRPVAPMPRHAPPPFAASPGGRLD